MLGASQPVRRVSDSAWNRPTRPTAPIETGTTSANTGNATRANPAGPLPTRIATKNGATLGYQAPLHTPTVPLSATTAHAQGDLANIGTIQVSDLSKNSKDALELASRFMDTYLERDLRFPDIERLLGQKTEQHTYTYAPSATGLGPLAPFERTDSFDIPDEIFDQYNDTQSYTKLGLFSSLGRAYITVDNRLYFWDYRSGSNFQSFEDLDQTIVSVNLVKPRKGCFVEAITDILVLCTPSDLTLLAVKYDRKTNDIQLFNTAMTVPIKGLGVPQVVGSDKTGRIFLVGANDGTNIWEILYAERETWFRGRCSKVCHTRQSFASALAPSFAVPSPVASGLRTLGLTSTPSTEHVTSMKIDDSRDLLYTLSDESTIRVYHIPSSKNSTATLTFTYRLHKIAEDFRMCNSGAGLPNQNVLRIVTLEVIPSYHSVPFILVATTAGGYRLFIKSGLVVPNAPPNNAMVVNFRPPPSSQLPGEHEKRPVVTGVKPTSRIFDPGHFFGVVAGEPGSNGDRVFVSSFDAGRVMHSLNQANSALVYHENSCFLDVEGYVQAVELLTPPFRASKTPDGFYNECAAQYTLPAPQIAVLTNTGLYVFRRRLLSQVFESLSGDIKGFFDLYGRTETCSSALSVASRAVSGPSPALRDLAAKVYIETGGRAHLRIDDERTFSLQQTALVPGSSTAAEFTSGQTVRLSGRFDGLATYLARVVRDLWAESVFKVARINKDDVDPSRTTFSLTVSRGTLEAVELSLIEVMEFLERNHAFIEGLTGMPDNNSLHRASKAEEVSLQAEHRGLNSLVRLIKSMREGIAFLLLLVEETLTASEGIEAIMAYLPVDIRHKMAALNYRVFFTTPEGTELAKELVTALINRSLSKGDSVDSISRVLQDRCESYCSPSDVIIYKALEYLRQAKTTASTDPDGKMQSLYESVRVFKKVAGSIPLESLKEAMREYVELKFYAGAVEVILSVAAVADRGNLAVGYLYEGKPAGDPREAAYNSRLDIYRLVFDVLDIVDERAAENTDSTDLALREEAYNLCFQSTDEVFHFCFYDWFFTKGIEGRLLDVQTQYVLPYLQANAKTSLAAADMLWVYCQKRGDLYMAAQVLFELVKSDFDIGLEQRLEFLSRAHGYTNCEAPLPLRQAMVQLGTSIQEHMEIASIQLDILKAVKEDKRFIEKNREETVTQLDGKLLPVSDLYNDFAEPLHYYQICLAIFQATDYRGRDEITRCWDSLVHNPDSESYENVSSVVQQLGQQFMNAEFVFPTDHLVPLLESYSLEKAPGAPRGWVVDTFLNAGVSAESLYVLLSDMLERKEYPFDDKPGYEKLAQDVAYLLLRWTADSHGRLRSQVVTKADLDKLRTSIDPKEYADILRRLR